MSFEKLAHGIPLHEAADFFIRLRTFDKTAEEVAPPDATGTLEGQFAVPLEQVLQHLAMQVQAELKTNFAYMVYANSLRDLAHHSIAGHFEEHAHDETEHADWLLRRMGVLGGPINVPDIPAPHASTDAYDIIQTMIRMEQEGIENWRTLRQMIGDENPTKFKIEEYLTQEQEHLDELWQLMPHEANPALMPQTPQAGATPTTTEVPQVPPSAPDTSPAPADHKTAAARVLGDKAKGFFGRAGQLLTGSRTRELKDAASHTSFQAAQHRARAEVIDRLDGAKFGKHWHEAANLTDSKASRLLEQSKHENAVSRATQGTAAAVGTVGVLGAAKKLKDKKKEEPKEEKKDLKKTAGPGMGLLGGMHGGSEEGAAIGGATFGIGAGIATDHALQLLAAKNPRYAYALDLADYPASYAAGALAGKGYGALKNAVLGDRAEKTASLKDRDEAIKEKFRSAASAVKEKNSELAPLPPTAMGQQTPASTPSPLSGASAGQHAKIASAEDLFKLALEGLSGMGGAPALAGSGGEAEEAPPEDAEMPGEPQMDPELMQYMQQEQAGMAAENQQEDAFYKQKFEAANQQLQAATQQMEQLQQQADATGEQQSATIAQAQQIQQAAMQNAQAAHAAATQSMQQSLQAQKDSIQQAQLAVGMRDSVHAMRQGLLQMVQQELPPATPAEAGAIQADMQAAAMGMQPGAPGGAPGQDNTQQPGTEGAPQDPNQAGQPAAAPDAGTPPAAATPGAAGPGTSPSAGAGAQPTMQGAQPQAQQGPPQEQPKQASAQDNLIGAIMGGTAGAGLGLAESHMSNDPLREKVKKLEDKRDSGGGFGNALNLAQAKARLAIGEIAERHPVAAPLASTAIGAMSGAALGPAGHELGGKVKKLVGKFSGG